MNTLVTVCLVVVGLINFVPVVGLFSVAKMEKAYDVNLPSNELNILMRHRALLFGVLGAFIIYAAFVPMYHVVAMVMAGVSMIGFVVLAMAVGGYNNSIFKVFVADLIGVGVLLTAVLLKVFS